MRLFTSLLLAGACVLPARADYENHPKALVLLQTLREDYGFSEPELDRVREALREAQKIPKLVQAELKNKESGKPKEDLPESDQPYLPDWDEYWPIHVTPRNIANGLRYLDDNAVWFAKAEAQYGVPPTVVASILGVETKYGTYTGKFRVLDALATQGFDHPTRAPFFFSELTNFFAFCRDAGRAADEFLGSYAGAMGNAQFMPSNYRNLAVDYDGNGRRDLWAAPDAIGSIANYLVNYDASRAFRRGEPLVVAAHLSKPLDPALPRNGKTAALTVGVLRAAGVEADTPLPDNQPAGLIELRRGNTREYWVALPNFYAIQTYNPRVFYAMAVTQLADALAAAQASRQTAQARLP